MQRKKERDVPHMRRMLRHLTSLVWPGAARQRLLALLVFPEGTDLSESNVMKSNVFARERGLPELQYVLHPKSAGSDEMY